MQDPGTFPIHDFGPAIPGIVIGGVGIIHVFVAQFAVGSGALLLWLEHRAGRGDDLARRFLDGFFLFLVLLSFVFGALTGVGMWLTAVQVSAPTIGVMVRVFHWVWAAEWCFFLLEVVSGYLFFRYRSRLTHRTRLVLLALYAISSWMSLFLINGILSWQLTPGEWVATQSMWSGFFNPSFWPSLIYRTLVAWTLAGLGAVLVVLFSPGFDAPQKRQLQRRIAPFFVPTVAMPLVGVWFLAILPADSRGWLLGGSVAMSMFLAIAIAASTVLGGYAIVVLVWQRAALERGAAVLLTVFAFAATGAGEFVREGVRKPYTVRHVLYSNAIAPQDVARLRREGCVRADGYPLRGAPVPNEVERGAKVFRAQCAVCHSVDGANGVIHLVSHWSPDQIRMNVARLQHTKAFMPPFAGTAAELEALTQWLLWQREGRPDSWAVPEDSTVVKRIQNWLDEAGVTAATGVKR